MASPEESSIIKSELLVESVGTAAITGDLSTLGPPSAQVGGPHTFPLVKNSVRWTLVITGLVVRESVETTGVCLTGDGTVTTGEPHISLVTVTGPLAGLVR